MIYNKILLRKTTLIRKNKTLIYLKSIVKILKTLPFNPTHIFYFFFLNMASYAEYSLHADWLSVLVTFGFPVSLFQTMFHNSLALFTRYHDLLLHIAYNTRLRN